MPAVLTADGQTPKTLPPDTAVFSTGNIIALIFATILIAFFLLWALRVPGRAKMLYHLLFHHPTAGLIPPPPDRLKQGPKSGLQQPMAGHPISSPVTPPYGSIYGRWEYKDGDGSFMDGVARPASSNSDVGPSSSRVRSQAILIILT